MQRRHFILRIPRPHSLWTPVRALSVAGMVALAVLALARPATGGTVVFDLVVPMLPLVFVFAPSVWRNVCPMAAVNRGAGLISPGRTLPPWLRQHGYLVGLTTFFVLAAVRPVVFEDGGVGLGVLLCALLAIPLMTGLLFESKSGFCGSICPLRPAQGLYGPAPSVQIDSRCKPCTGCTVNCPDTDPRGAARKDLAQPADRGTRMVFAGALPGFTFAFFSAAPAVRADLTTFAPRLLVAMLAGVGLLFALDAITKIGPARLVVLAASAALGTFYWFAIPRMAGALDTVAGWDLPLRVTWEARLVIGLAVARWLWRALRPPAAVAAPQRAALHVERREKVARGDAPVLAGEPAVEIPDRRSPARRLRPPRVTLWPQGKQVEVVAGSTLHDAARTAGVELPQGCGTGLCGCDPVFVLEGQDALSAPEPDERATLERLGLPAGTRLACCTRVSGDVSITLDERVSRSPVRATPAVPAAARSHSARIVVIGNGVAGVTAASHLRRLDPSCAIDLVTESAHPFYNKVAITRLISERSGMSNMMLMPDGWYAENRVVQWLNTSATAVDLLAREVSLGTGESLPYDRLVLANGARPRRPAVPGMDLEGVFTLGCADDAMAVRSFLQAHKVQRAVVVGGGLIGVEAADALAKLGMDCTVVEQAGWLCSRDIDETAGRLLAAALADRGVRLRTDCRVLSIEGDDRARQVMTADGRTLETDLVILSAGIAPRVDLALESGLAVANGVLVDATMRTSDESVFACGDVAEVGGVVAGRWPSAAAQAEVAAVNALGGDRRYSPAMVPTRPKVKGIDLIAIGRVTPRPGDEVIVHDDYARREYAQALIRDGRLEGVIAYGKLPLVDAAIAAVRDGDEALDLVETLVRDGWQPDGARGAVAVAA